ncbi:hypothetical protein BV22DRAFT_1194734 [Leucogyrophana mollusca]|uniref:Uncharacterized protein n=1 Tax=Leucogyrophana mollusca TaxID=85980 RepID=A0ACB8BK54_9AGAM|nr:hypothetical protein BV22DRAFT_1194734 [Leucogyrophana mollusca]
MAFQAKQEDIDIDMEDESIPVLHPTDPLLRIPLHDDNPAYKCPQNALSQVATRLSLHEFFPDRHHKAMALRALVQAPPEPWTLVVVGRTGVGKSTVINQILDARILSTGADGACTAVPTELHFEATPADSYRAVVQFRTKEDWSKHLAGLLEDIQTYVGNPQTEGNDGEPASDAWKTLTEVYPSLRTLSFPPSSGNVKLENLLADDIVSPLLGTEHRIEAGSAGDLETQLRKYLRSHGDRESALWHLVTVARIYGPFEALACGAVTLVDLPGYGDTDKTRSIRAREYVSRADQIVLVADIKRGVDEKETRSYLRDFLDRSIINGRQSSTMILLTGADNPITLHQLRDVSNQDWARIRGWEDDVKQLKAVTREADSQREHILNQFGITSDQLMLQTLSANLRKVTTELEDAKASIKRTQASKSAYIAHLRSKIVSCAFRDLFREVCRSTNVNVKFADSLPIFCIGSEDYRHLRRRDFEQRRVFSDIEETGIPRLRRHIRSMGYTQYLRKAEVYVQRCRAVLDEIRGFYKSHSTQNKKLGGYEGFAATTLRDLQSKRVTPRLDQLKMDIQKNILDLEAVVRPAASESADSSCATIGSLNLRYHTYRKTMRMHGQWKDTDVNDMLSKDIFNEAVIRAWSGFFCEKIPDVLQCFVSNVHDMFYEEVGKIRKRASKMKTICEDVEESGRRMNAKATLKAIVDENIHLLTDVQRSFDGSFKHLFQEELEPHYDIVGSETGPGMLGRMKALNENYFSTKGEALFDTIVDRVLEDIGSALMELQEHLEAALKEMYGSIRRTLVEKQRSAIDQTVKKKMAPEMLRLIKNHDTKLETLVRDIRRVLSEQEKELSRF